jgi:MFS family permease
VIWPGPPPSLKKDSRDGGLLTRSFLLVLVIAFLGFTFERVLEPVIPLIIIVRGGDATLVGFVVAVHALPSVLLRPVVGQLVDNWRHAWLLRLGAIVAAIAPVGVLLPGVPSLVPVRFLQGSAWAVYAVSSRALMAKLAPAERRGEASGYYEAMPALATLAAPGVGISLYLASGEIAPVLLASALGVAAFGIGFCVRIPGQSIRRKDALSVTPTARSAHVGRIVELSALPATFMITTFMAANPLFTVFPPLYAIAAGSALETLALYYAAYGIVSLLGRLAVGRASDRLGRGLAVRIGSAVAITGLVTAALGDGMVTFTAGAAIYALGGSLVSPAISAITIDRASPNRLGAAVATYSLGYQLGTGGSSMVWGPLIAAGGFSWAFGGAIGLQLLTIAASLLLMRRS